MKRLGILYRFIALAAIILLSINSLKAQCDIQADKPMPICSDSIVHLSVNISPTYRFVWLHNNDTLFDGQYNNIPVTVTENNSDYLLDVYNLDGSLYCHGETTVTMHPRFNIDFEIKALTCTGTNKGEIEAIASGGGCTSFTYQWDTPYSQYYNPPQLAKNLYPYTDYTVKVTSDLGCAQSATTRLKAYMNPNISMSSDPADTVYLDNPYVTWSFTNNDTVYKDEAGQPHDTLIEITNFYWEFDGYTETFTEENPRIIYHELEEASNGDTQETRLVVTSEMGCDSTYRARINVLPVQLKIPNIFTPNGDGQNDYFQIGYKDGTPINDLNVYFLSTKLVVFNRWGRTVYESKNYKNDWDGGKLPDGTYFYVLECKGYTRNYRYQGSVMIWNSGR